VTNAALWPYALDVYARPGVEALLLELQDTYGQCVPYVLWGLWMAAAGRPFEPRTAAACAELARAWQDAAVAPLRRLRRDLKSAQKAKTQRVSERIRTGVKALELEAERMLLQMLDEASPASGGPASDGLAALRISVRAWGERPPPAALLEQLARLTA
jgi:uncharacterized protein (TIGR02444 family)